ncbi:family 16 glycosylhydrolase [Alteromonas sp. CYL-A6]|uniref:family 16 glycosylhydrolase n=1 Tax=Alteromonas nitratireducens TaxID=3390813 RepID=UPI0034AA0A52
MKLIKRPIALALLAVLTTTVTGCNEVIESNGEVSNPEPPPPPPPPQTPEEAGWVVVWEDQFDDDTINTENWNFLTGDGSEYGIPGWGNNELQYYEEDNAFIEDGKLVIQAEADAVGGYEYTSARLTTEGKLDVRYGRIEASIKMPGGQGTWPAFWMLPTDSPYGDWAAGGEIDILESTNLGVDGKNEIQGTLHYGSLWPLNRFTYKTYEPEMTITDDFHRYAIEWEQGEIRWYFDDTHYATMTEQNFFSYYWGGQDSGFITNDYAPFNTPFHILLNLAIGGNLPGAPADDLALPLRMEVDYVRVYQCPADEETGVGCASNVNEDITPPAAASYTISEHTLFADGITPLEWVGNEETQTRALAINSWWNNDGALTLTTPDVGGDYGTVIDILTSNSGNVSIYAEDAGTLELYGVGSASQPWAPHNGEIIFDLYIDSAQTDPDGTIAIKMDSGYPNLGFINLAVSDLEMDTWQTLHLKLSDLLANANNDGANPVDVSQVVSLFVVEPTSSAHIMLDNVKFKCGAPGTNSCGIRAPSPEVNDEQVAVFVDEVDPVWTRGLGAWDSRTGFDYFEGDNDSYKVNWAVVDLDGNNVLEVSFDDDADATGVFYIQSLAGIDLTAYTNGYLSFDLRVLDYGSNTSGMAMKVDCFYPCTSGDQELGVVADVTWETINVPVQQLIDGGLDVSDVNTGIVIFPVAGDQGGVTFQIDNIVWTAGEPVDPEPTDPPVEPSGDLLIYNGTDTPDPEFAPDLNGITQTEETDSDDAYGTVAQFSFSINETTLPFFVQPSGTTIDLSAYSEGTIEFDLKLITEPSVGLDNTGFYVKFDSGYPKTTSAFAIAQPVLGEWRHYSISVADLLANGVPDWEQPVDITAVDAAFVVAPDWGTASGTVFQLDNIVWKP